VRFRPTRGARRTTVAIDITSLVDVVFLLLIFLLVTTTFKREEHAFPIQLPTAGVETLVVTSDKTTIFVTTAGEFHLLMVPLDTPEGSDGLARTRRMSREELATQLAALHARRPETPISIRAEKDTRYQKMIDVVALVERAGFRNIWFPYELEK
jgi:biopolymer transport protein ExbD